jgi:predicted DNA-binding protein
MSSQRPPKKSETLEIRIPYPTKTAFMEKAKAEGRAASEIVREQIDAYLEQETAPEHENFADKAVVMIRRNLKGAGLMLAGAGSALAISLAAAPATAGRGLDAPLAATGLNATDGSSPLMIVVDVPAGGLTAEELGRLVGNAFAKLDKNGNGVISLGE